MTWPKAVRVLTVCLGIDLARAFFTLLWFFGPALGAAYCSASVNDTLQTEGAIAGGITTACVSLAAAAGSALSAPLMLLGSILAMAVGLLGWLAVYTYLLMQNSRIFMVGGGSVLTMLSGLLLSEIPFLSALPNLTVSTGRLYRAQIKRERAALHAWEMEHRQALLQEKADAILELRAMRQAQRDAEERALAAEQEEIPEAEPSPA